MDERQDAATVRQYGISLPGLRMHVREAGAGQPVLMLHGFPQSGREFAPVMEDLARDRRVIAPDLRGAGQTDAPAAGYDTATVQSDIIALMDALEIDRASLVAHDWGAIVGFDLCLNHPERFTEYVAIAVPAPYLRMTPALAGALVRAVPHLWFQWVIATPVLGPRLLSHGRQRLARWILSAFETKPMRTGDVEAYVATLRDPAHAAAASKLYRGVILPGFSKAIRGTYRGRMLTTRTLILFGADDALLPRDALSVSSEDAPDTTVEFVPGGAHYLVDDNPTAVAARIRTFLGLPER
jgi:pimeloyl-ACP methyl ester carboxylesterase